MINYGCKDFCLFHRIRYIIPKSFLKFTLNTVLSACKSVYPVPKYWCIHFWKNGLQSCQSGIWWNIAWSIFLWANMIIPRFQLVGISHCFQADESITQRCILKYEHSLKTILLIWSRRHGDGDAFIFMLTLVISWCFKIEFMAWYIHWFRPWRWTESFPMRISEDIFKVLTFHKTWFYLHFNQFKYFFTILLFLVV